jgi:hypothetical protein
MVFAIALNFCLPYAIGLGAIDTAVRLRSCDCALASRIGALSLILSIHLFTSRRARSPPKGLCTTKATSPLDGKPIKYRFGFRSVSESPAVSMTLPSIHVNCVCKHRADDSVIPANVLEAVNFYQSKGLIHGSSRILVADPTHSNILGAFGPKLRS